MALKVRRNPQQHPQCPLTECMTLLSGTWTASIIWYLSAQPRRFNELRIDLPGISAKVLSSTLKQLVEKGVVIRRQKATSPPSVEYSLSDSGRLLIPALEAIIKAGKQLKAE